MSLPAIAIGLIAAVGAQRELLDELPPDREAWDNRVVDFGPEFERLPLPGSGRPKGLARIGEHLWFLRGDRLMRLSWPACAVEVDLEAAGLRSLCAGGRFLYGLDDDGLLVLDPIAGRPVRTIPLALGDAGTRAEAERKGLAAERIAAAGTPGKLLVATRLLWFEVDAETGGSVRRGKLLAAQWLAHDGATCWFGDQRGMAELPDDAESPRARRVARHWPWPLEAGAAVWIDGRLLLAVERGDRGNEGVFVGGVLAPAVDEAASCRLTLDVFWESGDRRKWLVGPKPLYSLDDCQKELVRLAADPTMLVRRPDGTRSLMQVVVRSHPKVTNADVAATWDAAAAAGFTDIRCPPIEGFVLAERRRRAAAGEKK